MEAIINQEFSNETIVFDGFNFIECTFRECIIMITSAEFSYEQCCFIDTTFHIDPDLPAFQLAKTLISELEMTTLHIDNVYVPS